MSIILNALNKLEHDKANRQPDPAGLDLEFLTPPAPRRSLLRVVLMMGLMVTCGSAATYLFMTRAEKTPAPVPPAASQIRQVAFMPATSAHPSVPLSTNSSSAPSPSAVPSPPQQAGQQPTPAHLAMKPRQAATKVQPESPPTQVPVAKQQVPQAAKTPGPQHQSAPLHTYTVNGLALSDGDKRKAIVNGMSVSVGSTIDGARIEDIQGDRVRFSYNGKTFDILVGSTGP